MFGIDLFSNFKSISLLSKYIDLAKVPDLLAAGVTLKDADVSTMDGAKAAVVQALGLVCPFTDITLTEKDAVLCHLSSKVAGSDLLVGSAAFAVYVAFGRRTRASGDPHLVEADVAKLVEEIHNVEVPETEDPEVRAKGLFTSPAKIFELVQLLVTLIGMFKS